MNKKGFTLMELIICIVIAAILAAVALPTYEQFVERMRTAEVEALAGSTLSAQVRAKLRTGRFTYYWHQLDTAPMPVRLPRQHNDYANGLANTVFYTQGGMTVPDGPHAGFAVWFATDAAENWFLVAQRVGKGGYTYRLIRPFDSSTTFCIPGENNQKDVKFCINYMGVDDASQLPPDPMQKEVPSEDEE